MSGLIDFKRKLKEANERGIERIVSTTLYVIISFMPGMYVRKLSYSANKVWIIDVYVLFKVALAILAFINGWYSQLWIRLLLILFVAETVVYNLYFILCANLNPLQRSVKRSLILGFLNFIEVTFTFGSFYAFANVISNSDEKLSTISKVDYIYFSLSSGGFLGFGNYSLNSDSGKILAITECLIYLMFFIFFISYNLSILSSKRN